jgi:hypothetical protein
MLRALASFPDSALRRPDRVGRSEMMSERFVAPDAGFRFDNRVRLIEGVRQIRPLRGTGLCGVITIATLATFENALSIHGQGVDP